MTRLSLARRCATAAILFSTAAAGSWADEKAAQAIFDTYLEATGGKAAHRAVKSRSATGAYSITGMDTTGAMEDYRAPPDFLFSMETRFGRLATGIVEGGAWSMSPFEGDKILEPAGELAARRDASLSLFLEWDRYFESATVAGEAKVNDTPCTKVIMTPAEGRPAAYYFALDSGLLLKSETESGQDWYSGYREVDGLFLPHRIRMIRGPATFEIAVEKIEHNGSIPQEAFAIPESIMALVSGEDEGSDSKDASK